jgi:hypothetical protein
MGYRHTPRSNRRPARDFTRKPMSNTYAAVCASCGLEVRPHDGLLAREAGDWTVRHIPQHWAGSPVSGRYVGGCEAARADAQASQEAAYATYTGNIAWSELCDEGEAARLAVSGCLPECDYPCRAHCDGSDCDITCNVHGPDVDRGPAYMGPAGEASYTRTVPASLARIERQQASGVGTY